MDSDSLRIAGDRLSRVFRFLEALNQHRNPPKRQVREQLWTLWLKDLIDHPAIQRGQPRNSQENNTDTVTSLSAREEEFILKVDRAKLTRPPKPPSELKFSLEVGWDDPTKELAVKETKNEQNTKGETFLVRFEDDTNRTAALETKRFSVASASSSLSRREWLSIP
jgi:hypothetical protein